MDLTAFSWVLAKRKAPRQGLSLSGLGNLLVVLVVIRPVITAYLISDSTNGVYDDTAFSIHIVVLLVCD